MQRSFTPHDIDHFIEHGYVIARGVIPRDIIQSCRRDMWSILQQNPDDPATWPEHSLMVAAQAYAATVPCRTSTIDQLAQQLVGPLTQAGHGYYPVLNFPRPGPRQWRPIPGSDHIDGPPGKPLYPSDRYVVVLAYLTDTEAHGGAVHLRPGSHRDLFTYCHATGRREALDGAPPDVPYRSPPIPIAAQAGDAVIFHYLMVHGSSHNHAGHVREAINTCVVPHPHYPYQPRQGPPRADWTPLDVTLRTDNLPPPVAAGVAGLGAGSSAA